MFGKVYFNETKEYSITDALQEIEHTMQIALTGTSSGLVKCNLVNSKLPGHYCSVCRGQRLNEHAAQMLNACRGEQGNTTDHVGHH